MVVALGVGVQAQEQVRRCLQQARPPAAGDEQRRRVAGARPAQHPLAAGRLGGHCSTRATTAVVRPSTARRCTARSSAESTVAGGAASACATPRSTLRTCAITTAALRSWPATSPTTRWVQPSSVT